MAGKIVTIRTLDLGGDKTIAGAQDLSEANPILGWRAIRFCLSRTDIFKSQLRAMLRASVHGNLQIMFPMISGIEELEEALGVLEEVKTSLKKEGIDFCDDIPVGICRWVRPGIGTSRFCPAGSDVAVQLWSRGTRPR